MKRHVIIGRAYGPGDGGRLPLGGAEFETRLDLVVGDRTLDHGIGRALSNLTTWLGVYPSRMGRMSWSWPLTSMLPTPAYRAIANLRMAGHGNCG